jgi:hypothetical protein
MHTLFFRVRVLLCRHLRTIWLRARSLFLSISIRFHRLCTTNANDSNRGATSTSTSTTNNNTAATVATATRTHRPPTPMPATKTRVYERVSARARELKAHIMMMRERRAAMKNSTKQTAYARMGAAAVAPSKEDLAGVTGKYCEDDVEEDEEGEEVVIRDITEAQPESDDPDAFEALFKSLSSSPTLRLDTWHQYGSPFSPPFSPSLSLPSPALREPESLLCALPIPSPTMSSTSSSSASRDTSAPTTPITPTTPLSFLRPHPRPRSRAHFRTFSASIAARSPLSLSFPLSLSLPLSVRRASTPGAGAMHRYANENKEDDDCDEHDGVREGGGEDNEDPFGTYGRAYYAPGARAALGLGDAYDLSAWTWARDYAPYRGAGANKRKHHVRTRRQQLSGDYADLATIRAGVAGGHGRVYRTPSHAASAPQLSCAQRPDRELEYLRALAKSTGRGRVARLPGPEPGRTSARDRALPAHRSGIRPLLLPQKLGLTGGPSAGVPGRETDKSKTDAMVVSDERGRKATGWELDLERGVFCEDGTEV